MDPYRQDPLGYAAEQLAIALGALKNSIGKNAALRRVGGVVEFALEMQTRAFPCPVCGQDTWVQCWTCGWEQWSPPDDPDEQRRRLGGDILALLEQGGVEDFDDPPEEWSGLLCGL